MSIIRPTAADIVTYDSVTSYAPHYPYRSEALFRPDVAALQRHIMATRRNGVDAAILVQVIRDHGDSLWTNAEHIRTEDVGDFGMQRYVVRLADGTEHSVSQDRIRPAR